MTTLVKEIGNTVFIGGSNIDNFSPMPIIVENGFFVFKNKVEKVLVDITEEFIAIHGLLTSAVSIPENVPAGSQIFIIIPLANPEGHSYILEVETVYLLQKIIETLVTKTSIEKDVENIADYISDISHQNIEDLFIVYGYTLDLVYKIDKDSVQKLEREKTNKCLQSIVRSQT
jgi:hypothetical protein